MTERRAEDDGDPSALSIHEARERVLDALAPIDEHERVAVRDAVGRVIAVDVPSPTNVPRFRASAMDGYAFRHADRERTLRLVGRSLAGHPCDDALPEGACVRITTGARVPDDADTVVQQENVVVDGTAVRLTTMPTPGLHVRGVGSDSARGASLIPKGTRLAAADIALLAAHGLVETTVVRVLRVALFSTGDELVDAGEPLGPGRIHDANRPLLGTLLAEPGVHVNDLGICADTPAALSRTFVSARGADIVVSSGGVSVGEADHVRDALASGGAVSLWKIAMKPGRPLTFGSTETGRPFFGLPGNPVSAAITALLFVRPALERLAGARNTDLPPPFVARLEGELRKRPGRVEFQRGVLSRDAAGTPTVTTTGLQDSHVLVSLQRANCLIELPLGSSGAGHGDGVVVHPFTGFGRSPL